MPCSVIAGDFNFPMDNLSDVSAKNFMILTESFNLHQHVQQTTHSAGHILDLVLTRCGEHIIQSTVIHDSVISDHFTIRCDLDFKKPRLERKRFTYRNVKAIDTDLFKEDIAQSPLTSDPSDDVTQLVNLYNSELLSILDRHLSYNPLPGCTLVR